MRRSLPSTVLLFLLAGLLPWFWAAPAAAQNGTVTGTVKKAVTNAALSAVPINVFSGTGGLVGVGTTSSSGAYSLSVPAGSYRVRTALSRGSTVNLGGVIDEVYNDVVCLGFSCGATAGDIVTVAGGSATSNINFTLDGGGRIGGTVTNALTGLPVSGVGVELFNAAGVDVGWTFTNSAGQYTSAGLPTGSYLRPNLYQSVRARRSAIPRCVVPKPELSFHQRDARRGDRAEYDHEHQLRACTRRQRHGHGDQCDNERARLRRLCNDLLE